MKLVLVIVTLLAFGGTAAAQDDRLGVRRDEQRPKSVRIPTSSLTRWTETFEQKNPQNVQQKIWRFIHSEGAPYHIVVQHAIPGGSGCLDVERPPKGFLNVAGTQVPDAADALLKGNTIDYAGHKLSLKFTPEEAEQYRKLRKEFPEAVAIQWCFTQEEASQWVARYTLGVDVYDREAIDKMITEHQSDLDSLTKLILDLPRNHELMQAIAKEIATSQVLAEILLANPKLLNEIAKAAASYAESRKAEDK